MAQETNRPSREERLAAKLRENLRRRKVQSKAQSEARSGAKSEAQGEVSEHSGAELSGAALPKRGEDG